MEAFSLLKYWRTTTTTTANATALPRSATKTAVPCCSSDEDCEDGPYFDLEFTLPAEDDEPKPQENDPKAQPESEPESGSDSEDPSDQENEEEEEEDVVSPSDELFFKGDLVSIEHEQVQEEEEDNKLSVTNLLKPATKFRVLLLKLKKSKQGNGINIDKAEKDGEVKRSGKLFTLKFKVEEAPPLVSLFSRDNSSKRNGDGGKGMKGEETDDQIQKRFVVVQKYLKMVKPLYGRVSKMKKSSTGVSNGVAAEKVGGDGVKQAGNVKLQGGPRVVRKQLAKSRSAVVSAAPAPGKVSSSNRLDDSLLQLQDGIQGAILHCKKSFNAATEVESSTTMLSRSVSDASSSYEKSVLTPKVSSAPPLSKV